MIELFADRIFDGARFVERPLCITIEGETIASVRSRSADERLPPGGIDARGHTVLPGLIDAHTHIGRAGQFEAHEPPNPGAIVRNLEAALEGGVTTVGDMGCTAALIRVLREHTHRTPDAGPAVRASGPLLADPGGYPLDWMSDFHRRIGAAIPCGDENSARAAVERLARAGMDHVKICIMHRSYGYQELPVFSPEVARAFVAEAHALGLRVFAHAHWEADYRLALDAGVDALMHSSFDPLSEETVLRVRDAGIPVCPTLWVFHSACFGLEQRWDRDPERGRGVVRAVRKSWTRYAEAYAASGLWVPDGIAGGATKEQGREAIRVAAANLCLLSDAGVPFAFGSDGPFGFSVIGRPLDELQIWESAGLSREQCLGYATAGAARLLGLDDRGTIADGRRADLVIVDGDPRRDLDVLRRPATVIRAGVPVTRRHRLRNAAAVAVGLGNTLLDAARDLARDL